MFSGALLLTEQNWFFQTPQIITSRVMSYQEQSFEDFEPRGSLNFWSCQHYYSASRVMHCHKGNTNKCPGRDST